MNPKYPQKIASEEKAKDRSNGEIGARPQLIKRVEWGEEEKLHPQERGTEGTARLEHNYDNGTDVYRQADAPFWDELKCQDKGYAGRSPRETPSIPLGNVAKESSVRAKKSHRKKLGILEIPGMSNKKMLWKNGPKKRNYEL